MIDSVWRQLSRPQDTAQLGALIAGHLQPGDAVCLQGPLGAGKSTLARGAIRALTRPDEEAPSPTFTLAQTYEGPRLTLTHFDLYRVRSSDEILELGLEEALDRGAVLIEWPERLGGDPPVNRLDIELRLLPGASTKGRLARLSGRGVWIERANELIRQLDDEAAR